MTYRMAHPVRMGQYEIIEEIGRNFVVVYKARDTVVGRLVALKVFTSCLATERENFLREARAASVLQHPNIAAVFELAAHEENPYVVMEYVDGQTLDRAIRTGVSLTLLQKIDIMLQVAQALQYAHEKGIVYLDIKPCDIKLTQDGSVKVGDYHTDVGYLSDQTISPTGQIVGTINYMSPEQLNGQPVDARTNIFSWGVVLYQLLTGKLPFQGADLTETVGKIFREPPPRLPPATDVNSPDLQPIIDKALAKDRGERYQTCSEIENDLSRFHRRIELGS
jgi:eukaryotic-like serine/threonine-protein kinase